MKCLAAGLVLLALVGCAQVQQSVQLDTSDAIARAKANGSPQALERVRCYEEIAPLLVAPAGAFDLYEQIMEGQELVQGVCAQVVVGVVVTIAKFRP
jgi:hypothetical protein